MTEAEWWVTDDPAAMVVGLPSPPNVRKLALFAVAACRADADLMSYTGVGTGSSRDHVEWSERIIEKGLAGKFDGPSDGDCLLMPAVVNRCVALACGAAEEMSIYAIGNAQDLIEC